MYLLIVFVRWCSRGDAHSRPLSRAGGVHARVAVELRFRRSRKRRPCVLCAEVLCHARRSRLFAFHLPDDLTALGRLARTCVLPVM